MIYKIAPIFLLGIAVLFMPSCSDDGGIVIDPGTGINVADGFYITQDGVDPGTSAQLRSENVEDAGFSSQARSGFVANYVYLSAGNYNLVEISSKEISKTLGGAATTNTDGGSSCDLTDYGTVTLVSDGSAINIGTSGLYKVTYDALTAELFYFLIEKVNLIGSATPGGWGADTDVAGSASSTGGTWQATGVEMRQGEYKIRLNCNWNIDRRLNKVDNDDFSEAAGYMLFTNFGGSLANLVPGNDGANIPIVEAEEGIYTVDITWTPGSTGFKATLTKTGEVVPITFVPDDHEWALTGSATPNNWADDDDTNDPIGVDHDMNYEGFDSGTNIYTWEMASLQLLAGGEFKFRSEDKWDENMGWEARLTLTGEIGNLNDPANGNIGVTADQLYKIVLTTNDDGETYTATFTEL